MKKFISDYIVQPLKFSKNQKSSLHKKATANKSEYVSLFWTLMLILFFRSFLTSPFQIPSESLYPTMLVGDHLFATLSAYDVKVPFTNKTVFKVSDPKRGQIVVFNYPNYENDPVQQGRYYIKRLIGLPGDKISMNRGVLKINGVDSLYEKAKMDASALPGYLHHTRYNLYKERLNGEKKPHWIRTRSIYESRQEDEIVKWKENSGETCVKVPYYFSYTFNLHSHFASLHSQLCEFTVPDNHYFFVGDNRYESSDSRAWGFVERKLIIGKATSIWFSIKKPEEGGLPMLAIEKWLFEKAPPFLSIVRAPRAIIMDSLTFGKHNYIRWNRIGYSDFN